jgi:hypothetical protein
VWALCREWKEDGQLGVQYERLGEGSGDPRGRGFRGGKMMMKDDDEIMFLKEQ